MAFYQLFIKKCVFMEFLFGTATPDTIKVQKKNSDQYLYNASCDSPEGKPKPFIYGYDTNGNKRVWLGKACQYHYALCNEYKEMVTQLIDGRLWENLKIMSIWDLNKGIVQKNIKGCLTDLEQRYKINLSDYSLLYNTGKDVVKKISIDEFLGREHQPSDASDTSYERELHLMSPTQKQQELQTNDEYKKRREAYAKASQNAWISKHGSIDPAYYHLLMYQEGKSKKLTITESDIKKMVKECIRRIKNKKNENESTTH